MTPNIGEMGSIIAAYLPILSRFGDRHILSFVLLLSLKDPAILASDFNADGSDPQIRKFLTVPGVVDALAARRPSKENRGIDWIFVRGLQPVDAGLRDESALDHPVVWAELVLRD